MGTKKYISVGILMLVFALLFIYFYYGPQQSIILPSRPSPLPVPQDTIIIPTGKIYDPTNTGIVTTAYDVRGVSMQPMIHNGDKIMVDLNYYNNGQHHQVTAGDVVIFENPFTLNRIIKRVLIVPGDTVQKDLKNKTLLVNGKILVNSVGESYIFDDLAYKWIDIYTKSGVIMANTYYLYGDNIHGSLDSRKTGPVTMEGILGKEVGIIQ